MEIKREHTEHREHIEHGHFEMEFKRAIISLLILILQLE